MRPNDLYSLYCIFRSVTSILEYAVKIHIKETACTGSRYSVPGKRRRLDNDDGSFEKSGPGGSTSSEYHQKTTFPQYYQTSKPETINQTPSLAESSFAAGVNKRVQSHNLRAVTRSSTMNTHSRNLDGTQNILLENQYIQTPSSAPNIISLDEISSPVKMLTEHKDRPFVDDSLGQSAPPPGPMPLQDAGAGEHSDLHTVESTASTSPALRASKVPSSRIGRMFHYGGLVASLGYGAASEVLRRSSFPDDPDRPQSTSLLMTESNLNRLVSKLSQMRGAALKLGQFMSIQDSHVLPEELDRVLRRVQDSAHYMPNWQMENVMSSSLGPSWRSHFSSFNPIPSHAASIGQVHLGTLAPASSLSGKEEEVAIKIQFPKVAESISSDLSYVKLLLGASALLPKGLFLDSTIKAFKGELADECDYTREARYIRKFRDMNSMKSDSRYRVPWVWDGSTEHVLVMERMKGVSVGGDIVNSLTQVDRDEIASRIIELCLRELFEFKMMQTDPNWSNFLWNQRTCQVELIDFGATREYSKEFMDKWLRLLAAAVNNDRDLCIEWSRKIGYFMGGENEAMINAHLTSLQLLGTPFRDSTVQPFSFARGSSWTDITEGIRAQIPIMLKNRLTPPPRETYSLNRKLSGAFLLAGRLGASVDCRSVWERVVGRILAT